MVFENGSLRHIDGTEKRKRDVLGERGGEVLGSGKKLEMWRSRGKWWRKRKGRGARGEGQDEDGEDRRAWAWAPWPLRPRGRRSRPSWWWEFGHDGEFDVAEARGVAFVGSDAGQGPGGALVVHEARVPSMGSMMTRI